MRFATKFDRWLVVVLAVGAFVTCVVVPAASPVSRPIFLLPLAIWVYVLAATLPQYYEVRPEGLFIRQGVRRILIPWPELAELQPMRDARSAGVYSMDRVLVVTTRTRLYIIAPADQRGFLDAVASHASQLERRPFGLGLPFAAPTVI